jgi:hypothetical protein
LAAFKVRLQPTVSRAIGFADLSRPAHVRLLTRLVSELPGDVELYRHRRVPNDPDSFEYRIALFDQDQEHPRRYLFRFAINDKLTPNVLEIVNVRFSSRPGSPEQ